MKHVLCIAEICCDIIFGGLSKIPILGEEEYCSTFTVKAGGGANTAMGLSRLGGSVSMFTRLGHDEFGRIVYKQLIDSGIKNERSSLSTIDHKSAKGGQGCEVESIMLDKKYSTAVSAVMSTKEDRCFASYGGGYGEDQEGFLHEKQYDRLEQAIIKADHVHTHVGYCIESPIVKMCRKHNKTLSLDTSWIPGLSLSSISEILSYSTYFTPNDKEAMELTKTSSPSKALIKLSENIKGTIVTMGAKGSISMISGRIHHQPAIFYGQAVDSTGAGDLYLSGLLYGLINGADKKKAMLFASHAAGYSVTYYGGVDESLSIKKLNI